MADFYRRTKVEELGAKHPGLLEFVNKGIRERVPYPLIASAIQDEWGEEVSPQVLSNYYILRLWKNDEEERKEKLRAYTESLGKGRALMELQKENPTAERAELIDALIDAGIVMQQSALMEKDPLKLLGEQRKRTELEQRQQEIEIEKGKLAVALKDSETARMKAESELARVQNDLKAKGAAVAGVIADEKANPDEVRRQIREIFSM